VFFPLWSVLFFLDEVAATAPTSLRPVEGIVALQWWICGGCMLYLHAVDLIMFGWAYASQTIFLLSLSERYNLFLVICYGAAIRMTQLWSALLLFSLRKWWTEKERVRCWCNNQPAQLTTTEYLSHSLLVQYTYLCWTLHFQGCWIIKINRFNGYLTHYKDYHCPVPPSYVYLQVSLMVVSGKNWKYFWCVLEDEWEERWYPTSTTYILVSWKMKLFACYFLNLLTPVSVEAIFLSNSAPELDLVFE